MSQASSSFESCFQPGEIPSDFSVPDENTWTKGKLFPLSNVALKDEYFSFVASSSVLSAQGYTRDISQSSSEVFWKRFV